MNLPNLITLGRLLRVPLAIWLVLTGEIAAAFWLFIVAGLSDAVDGFVAKRFDQRSRLGALLDPVADKTLLVSMYVTLGISRSPADLARHPRRLPRRADRRRLPAGGGARPAHALGAAAGEQAQHRAADRARRRGAGRAGARPRAPPAGFRPGLCHRSDDGDLRRGISHALEPGAGRARRPRRDHRPAAAGLFLAGRAGRPLPARLSPEPDPAAFRRGLRHRLFPQPAGASSRALARAAQPRHRAGAAALRGGGGADLRAAGAAGAGAGGGAVEPRPRAA